MKRARKRRPHQEPVRQKGYPGFARNRVTIDPRWLPDYVARGLEQLDAYRHEGHQP